MQDPPRPESILEFVAAFLRNEVIPQSTGAMAFQLRVCANAVDLVRREITLAPGSDAVELASLKQLLDAEGDLETLNVELCDRIQRREIGLSTPGLVEHLRQLMLAKLEVDQPNYASYRRARETWAPAAAE